MRKGNYITNERIRDNWFNITVVMANCWNKEIDSCDLFII